MKDKIKVKGYANYASDISTDTFTSIGQCILQSIHTNEFRNSGTCKVKGRCTTTLMTNRGSATLNSLVADQVDSLGSLRVETHVTSKIFHAKGHVMIRRELEAQFITLLMTSVSHISNIKGAKEITVRSHAISTINFFGFGKKTLRSERIEGKVIWLEHTVADLVIGECVYIGKGCEIKEILYAKSLDIHPDSTVNFFNRTEGNENEKCL